MPSADILALLLVIANQGVDGQRPSSPAVEARETEIRGIDAQLDALAAEIRASPEMIQAEAEASVATLALIKKYKPGLRSEVEAFEAEAGRLEKLAREGRMGEVAEGAAKLGPIQDRLAAAAQDPTIASSREMAEIDERLIALQWRLMEGKYPSVNELWTRKEQLTVEVRGLRGELRRSRRGAAPKLSVARAKFQTAVKYDAKSGAPQSPPKELLELVRYAGPLGKYSAYVSPVTGRARRPAVIYIHGGFYWGIGDSWSPEPKANDQSGSAFHRPDLVVMHPALRGASDNPGKAECMLGEVDDVIAAAKYLRSRKDVDPDRIYLVGHSTGATLALLVGETADVVRGIFALGPISNPQKYGPICGRSEPLPDNEAYLRSPIEFIEHLSTPTWAIEGQDGNRESLLELQFFAPRNVRFVYVRGADHFNVIRPATEAIAQAIRDEAYHSKPISISESDIQARMTATP